MSARLKDRNKKIYDVMCNGGSLRRVGKIYGISFNRVRQVFMHEQEKEAQRKLKEGVKNAQTN